MTIGSALFARLTTDGFARLRSEITGLQSRVADSTNDPRPSADPVRAMRLSALNDQNVALAGFRQNAEAAANRLALTDTMMAEVNTIARELQTVALQAANGTQTPEGIAALRSSALALRDGMLAAANTTDSSGRALLNGFSGNMPFVQTSSGTVAFAGDGATGRLRLSESVTIATGLAGEAVMMSVPTDDGPASVFDIVDDLIATLSPDLMGSDTAVASSSPATLRLRDTRAPEEMSFVVKGPLGEARITAPHAEGVPGPMLQAINAAAAATGITATLAADGRGISLTSSNGGAVSLADMTTTDTARAPGLTLTDATGAERRLRPTSLSSDSVIARLGDRKSVV